MLSEVKLICEENLFTKFRSFTKMQMPRNICKFLNYGRTRLVAPYEYMYTVQILILSKTCTQGNGEW